MAETVILVNGLPGSGKTTLATSLAAELRAPLLSKDAFKSALAASIVGPVPVGWLGTAAMEAIWALAAGIPETVIVESWWFRPRDLSFAQRGLRRAGGDRILEVWCDCPVEAARPVTRVGFARGSTEDGRHLAEDWTIWSEAPRPLGVGLLLRVDTRAPVDTSAVTQEVQALIGSDDR